MSIKAIIFDLDGTLLDTLSDLTDSVNFALGRLGYPERTRDEVRRIVGRGPNNLIARALPDGAGEDVQSACLSLYKKHYEVNKDNKTAPYSGIADALQTLDSAGYAMAVVSNKHEDALLGLCERFFPKYISVAVGSTGSLPRKPAPDMIRKALALLRCEPGDAVYIGDSEVDVECAKNAGLRFIGVSWGFRDEGTLASLGARIIAHKPRELHALISGL